MSTKCEVLVLVVLTFLAITGGNIVAMLIKRWLISIGWWG